MSCSDGGRPCPDCQCEDEPEDDRCGCGDCSDCEAQQLVQFANPGGNSALRAATTDNPRNLPCPTCGRANMLTPLDKSLGYQCDICADNVENSGGPYGY